MALAAVVADGGGGVAGRYHGPKHTSWSIQLGPRWLVAARPLQQAAATAAAPTVGLLRRFPAQMRGAGRRGGRGGGDGSRGGSREGSKAVGMWRWQARPAGHGGRGAPVVHRACG